MSNRVVKAGVTLAAIAAICTALVAATYTVTTDRIAANEQAWLEQSLTPALSGVFFEGSVTESMLVIPPPHDLPGSEAAIVYRVFAEGEPVAALFVVSARDGYAGPIRILVGVGVDGLVSDWVYQFDGRSLADPVEARWLLRTDGGDFDQLTGASVTPRAVIKAIRETLVYFAAHRDEILTAPATGGQE